MAPEKTLVDISTLDTFLLLLGTDIKVKTKIKFWRAKKNFYH